MDAWWYVLGEFSVRRSIHYSEGRHMFFDVRGYAENLRGSQRRRPGKETEGIWRPTDVNRVT